MESQSPNHISVRCLGWTTRETYHSRAIAYHMEIEEIGDSTTEVSGSKTPIDALAGLPSPTSPDSIIRNIAIHHSIIRFEGGLTPKQIARYDLPFGEYIAGEYESIWNGKKEDEKRAFLWVRIMYGIIFDIRGNQAGEWHNARINWHRDMVDENIRAKYESAPQR